MSQRSQSDGGQKGFAVGRGLLAAAETLNFSMSDQRSGRQAGGMASGVGSGGGGGVEGQDTSSQMSRRDGGGNLGSTMKLFASLGLSPSDLDALAQIPEEDISVETLPQILMQLKSRKGDVGDRPVGSSMSSDKSYRGGRDSWGDMHMGRMGGSSLGQGSASADFGFSSLQGVSSSRGYNLNYSGGGESRERPYSELSRHDSYGGLGMGPSSSDPVFAQRRMGSPSQGKIQDFLGVMPAMFPHVCSLCDFDVHSAMEWNQHTNGLRHAEKKRQLLNMYLDWDPSMATGRSGSLLDNPNLSPGLLGPAPMSSGQMSSGMPSSWGGGGLGSSGKKPSGQNKLRSRVVVVKYDRKPLSNKTLFAFTEPFGRLREHLVLKNKAFLEMETHEEAQDVVNYYQQHPASLYGKHVTFYLSQRLMVIEKDTRSSDRLMDRPHRDVKGRSSQVVFFSNLPREEEKKKELLTIAGRFGVVEKHLFLTDQAFVQLETPEDAEMLVKYYTVNPLTIRGRPIRLNICTKYKTLTVNRRQGASSGDGRGWRGGASASGSAARAGSSSKSSSASKSREPESRGKSAAAEEDEDEEEEEVSGVMEGDGEGEGGEGEDGGEQGGEEEEEEELQQQQEEEQEQQVTDAEGAEPTTTKQSEDVREEEPDGDDVTGEEPGHADEAAADAEQGAEPEVQAEPIGASAEEQESKEEQSTEPESSEMVEGDESDMEDQGFLENMEDFVTLDELAEDDGGDAHEESDVIDNSRKGGMRVVNIVGFRRGYNFLNELLALAKPFGKVVKHLVLDLRPEAYLQFATEEEARAMANFYNSNITASVCGRPVRISHSLTYPTIQSGSSKVVYVGQIPNSKYSDEAILKLAEPFGRVRKYFLNRIKRECFIEMENAEDAEKMAQEYKENPQKFNGKRLTIYVSRKYRQLKHGHRCLTVTKREKSSSPPKSSKHPEEPPAKKVKEEPKPAEEAEETPKEEEKPAGEGEEQQQQGAAEQKGEEHVDAKTENYADEKIPEDSEEKSCPEVKQEEQQETEASANQNGQADEAPPAEDKPSVASLPLPPFDPNTPIGVEHVKMGYYCRVCFLFYSREETAKRAHCSSQAHYDKLQKHLEKEQKKRVKKTSE